MSHKSNQYVSYWKDVEELISRRTPKFYQGTVALDDLSRETLRDAIMLWYLVTWDTRLSSGYPLSKDTAHRWLISISAVPIRELVDSLKDASHLLVTGAFANYDAFKQHLRESYPFIGAILAPMKRDIDHWFLFYETDALHRVYSWLLFLTRLNLPGLSDLEAEALSKYLRIEEELPEDGFSSGESYILEKWFPRVLEDMVFLTENHSPQHGPGSTSDAGKTLQTKYDSLAHDQKLSMLCRRVYDTESPYPRPAKIADRWVSETIFVPKSLGSYRTISMEPASIMWHQKGVRNAWLSLLRARKHYLLRRFQPELQQPNRDRAWIGSIDGSFSTIDLSSASDTVSWNLVKKWFFNTSLYPWLLWTRSTHTKLPDGSEIKLRKFAPMGSDLCFPVEVMVFVAIVECAIMACGDNPVDSDYRVYGDDIVVEEKYVPEILRRLTQNGFIPNKEKTFSGAQPLGFFRESCGGYFFNGVDITPIRLSRRFDGYSSMSAETPGRIESIIELANDCYSRYPSVRRWCVHQLLLLPRHLQPLFSRDGSQGLFSPEPTNFHLSVRDSVPLQTQVFTFGSTRVQKRTRRKIWEDIRYYEYLRQVDGRQRLTWPSDRVDVDVSPVPPPSWVSKKGTLHW